MIDIIVQAAENFCIHQIRLDYVSQKPEQRPASKTLLAYIDVTTANDVVYRTYIGCNESMNRLLTKIFLDEDDSDEESLIDMLLETTNMIVGSAKVVAQKEFGTTMDISTPFLADEDVCETLNLDESHCIKIDDCYLAIATKRL